MGSEVEEVGLSVDFVRENADEIASACAGSLTLLLGTEFSASVASVDAVDASNAIGCAGPVVHALCRGGEGSAAYSLHVVAATEEAAVLAGLQMGEDADQIEEATKQELSSDRRTAFQVTAKSLLNSVAKALGDALQGDISVQDAREIADPADDPTWLDPGNFVRLRLSVECEMIENGILYLLLPGDGQASASCDASLVFLERGSDESERLEDLGKELGCELTVEPPETFLAELSESDRARIIIVPWDLGGRSGLELVEALRSDPRLIGARFVMSSDAPTRGQVGAAMRAGASSFLRRPYLKQEIESRLLGRSAAAPVKRSAEVASAENNQTGNPSNPE